MTDQLFHILNNNYFGKEYLFVGTPQFKYLNYTDLNSAVEAMHYHSAIIKSTLNTAIDRRTGKPKDNSFTHIGKEDTNSLLTNHKLLENEGSAQYSTWLKSTASIERSLSENIESVKLSMKQQTTTFY
ncbi:hypothetical protein DOY81_008486 [Sarcophaga bullata]|nr:hypothetical protein DOY81_008486 [Sarcophaga bullata]